jgi:hypothetical protein
VAVVISLREYEQLTKPKGNFWDALEEWRASVDWDEMGDIDEVFKDVRDRSPGRDFHW